MQSIMIRNRPWLVGFGAVLLVGLVVLYFVGSVLLTFALSAVLAYVLLPVARLIERGMPWRHSRPGLARSAAVGIIFLAVLAMIVGILGAVIPPTIDQGRQFADDFPEFLNDARATIEEWTDRFADVVPEDVRDQVEQALAGAGEVVGGAAWGIVRQTVGVVSGSFAFIIGLATVPVLVFYLMKDSTMIVRSLQAPFPAAMRPYVRDFLKIADRTLGAYVRGQLVLGAVVGVIVTLGLLALGIPFAVVLGIVAGLTELVPVIGPWIGGAVGVLVTLATEPDKVLWVILLYVVVQLLENTLLVPRIQAETLNLHPVAVILVITLGSQFFGLWGVILGPPLVALGRDLTLYFLQQWGGELQRASLAGADGAAPPDDPETSDDGEPQPAS